MAVVVSIGTGANGIGTATVNVECLMNATNTGYRNIQLPTLSNAHSPCTVQSISLALGDNAITVPSTAGGIAVIAQPTNTTVDLTWKGANALDTGTVMNKAGYLLHTFATPPPSYVYMNASGPVVVEVIFF